MNIAEVAQTSYVEAQIRLDEDARNARVNGAPLTAGIIRNWAKIAWRAARAERTDPEPDPVRPCPICCGVRACDWPAHQSRFER